jgi:hypothetical protein
VPEKPRRGPLDIIATPGARHLAPGPRAIRQCGLGLRARPYKLPRPPCRPLVIAENAHCPEVTLRPGVPAVPDCAPSPALGMNHQLGGRAEPAPFLRRCVHTQLVPSAKFPRELSEPIRWPPAQAARPCGAHPLAAGKAVAGSASASLRRRSPAPVLSHAVGR